MSTPQPDLSLRLYGVAEVAETLGITQRLARHLFDTRAFPVLKIGRRIFVRHADLCAYIDTLSERGEK